MKHNVMLTIASLLSILFTFHHADIDLGISTKEIVEFARKVRERL